MNRRYDIDWLRVIAIGLLMVYHVAIGFQSWGVMIGFITTDKIWSALWTPMMMLNVWRIPLLFFVSGMGVYMAIQNRNWKELIKERAVRILIPFLFGAAFIVPLHVYIWEYYYHFPLNYAPNPGHLWFLGNIFVYVLLFTPLFFYIKRNEDGSLVKKLKAILSHPLGLVVVILSFILEAIVIDPTPYELYAMTWHGFFLGMLAFFFGFCFMLSGEAFRKMLERSRWFFLATAIVLFILRLYAVFGPTPVYVLVVESQCWIFSIFAFSSMYLNRSGKVLTYLSQAVYPLYIIHMVFLYIGSLFIFKLNVSAPMQYIMLLMFTIVACFAFYEFVITRIKYLRPLFGLKESLHHQQITKQNSPQTTVEV